jgi:Uma2 family endonuclease
VSITASEQPASEPVSTIRIPRGRPLTVDDLEHFPLDDGNRYELVEGMLLVSPSPVPLHQACVLRIGAALESARPADLLAFIAPLDWKISEDTVFQPDALICRPSDLTSKRLEGSPLLCVEVLSPSTRARDLALKRYAFARARVPSYWVFDPRVPSLTELRLRGDEYEQYSYAEGDAPFVVDLPFPVEMIPSALVVGVPDA